jgi:hypothetical protein
MKNKKFIYFMQQVMVSIALLSSLSCRDSLITSSSISPEGTVEIERPLQNAEARQLIQAMPDKKVLLTMICPKNLGLHESDFQQFPTVFYEENTQEALLFIPKQALGDAQLALQAYSESHPAAKDLQLIPIQDPRGLFSCSCQDSARPWWQG